MELTAGGKANREKYRSHIQAAELEFGLPEDLLMQLLGQESRFESSVIDLQRLSTKKAKGFGQFMLPTAQYAAQKLHITEDEMWKPLNQIRMSGFILKESIDRFKKDSSPEVAKNAVMWTYAEYNAGGGKIKRALEIARKGGDYLSALPKETQQYTGGGITSNLVYFAFFISGMYFIAPIAGNSTESFLSLFK